MLEFVVRLRVTYSGAECIVRANTAQEALRKAEAGEWESITLECASLADWSVQSKAEEAA